MRWLNLHNKPTQRRTLLLLVLAFILAWSQSGFVVWNAVRTYTYQFVRLHRPAGNTDTIFLRTNDQQKDLVWLEEHEVRYKGRMFDIVNSYTSNGLLVLTGRFDERDRQLFECLFDLLDDDGQEDQRHKKQLWTLEAIVPWCNLPYYLHEQARSIIAPRGESTLISSSSLPPSPPPKLV